MHLAHFKVIIISELNDIKETLIKPGLLASSKPQDLDCSLEVVVQDDLSPDVGKIVGQEMTLIPIVFDSSEEKCWLDLIC